MKEVNDIIKVATDDQLKAMIKMAEEILKLKEKEG